MNNERNGKPRIRKSIDGRKISSAEVKGAIAKMKKAIKIAEPSEIVTEMVAALDDLGIAKVTEVNGICDGGDIPAISVNLFLLPYQTSTEPLA